MWHCIKRENYLKDNTCASVRKSADFALTLIANVRDIKMENDFRKSSFCANNACVEVKFEDDVVFVRDSDGDYVLFSRDEWKVFIAGVKQGEFDIE